MTITKTLATAALVSAASLGAAQAQTAEGLSGQQLGELACTIEGGWGLILGSSKEINCEFRRRDGSVDLYTGTLDKVGFDIGKTERAYMTWLVVTTEANMPGDDALAGTYVGVSAGASLGIGLGVNALVGGSQDQIGLQPFSVEGVEGANLAVGLAALKLVPAR